MKIFIFSILVLSLLFVQYGSTSDSSNFEWSGEAENYNIQKSVNLKQYNESSEIVSHQREKREVVTAIVMVVGAIVNIAGSIMKRKHAEEAAKRYKETMKFKLEQLCDGICVTEWSTWNQCTKQCGNGKRERTRQHQLPGKCASLEKFTCRHSVKQESWCNMGCPNGGSPSQRGCACVPGYHGNCCQFATVCDYPGKPRNGGVSGVFPAGFRSVALYSCAAGFEMEGSDAVVCQADGSWSDTPPQCNAIKCAPDSAQSNVRVLNPAPEYSWGEEIYYTCHHGYVLRGPDTRRCTQQHGVTRWTGFNPSCQVVQCDPPVAPLNGQKNGTNHRYGDHVSFRCDQGFKLIGSPSITCLATGQWAGREPTCDVISCDPPLVPKHGSLRSLRSRSHEFSSLVVFDCDEGYVLEGSAVLQCDETGYWNGTEPRCITALCGNPGSPLHGYKDGSKYHYPHRVKYGCHSGYLIHGSTTLSCRRNGTWDGTLPRCEACPSGTYMDQERDPGSCTSCPSHSHTLTEASTHRQQCVCDEGYSGPPGGPCNEILCPPLSPPVSGSITCTGNKVDHHCNVSCDPGHVIKQGANRRACLKDGTWSGREVVCESCPVNTHQSEERICVPCPDHAHTQGQGHTKTGCTCDQGYTGPPGGPCVDANECLANGGKGPCEDLCENREGEYRCGCSVPGYKISPTDPHTCIVEKQCQNLTEVDAPLNGGLVCHWYREENSQQCGIRCNKGYEYPDRTNNYEYCGQNTGYRWSFRQEDPTAAIEPCIEEFFQNFTLEADSSYFVTDCDDLSEEDKEEVKREFARVLDRNGICRKRETKACDISNMAIICGRRRKRSSFGYSSSVDLKFKLQAIKLEEQPKNCDQVCAMLKIAQRSCTPRLCVDSYKRFLKATLLFAKRKLSDLFELRSQRVRFNVRSRTFEPDAIRTSDVIIECDNGMVERSGLCVPCSSGTYYNSTNQRCQSCPLGAYNPLEGGTECFECPPGSTTYTKGSAMCQVCRSGTFGEKCKHRCSCSHGYCHQVTGECVCDGGWTGHRCDQDVPGCADHACADDFRCVDIQAPGTGYRCVRRK